MEHNYGISWIDNKKLLDVTTSHFAKVYKEINKPLQLAGSRNAIDPFTALFQLGGTPALDFDSWVAAEKTRQSVKTLQNAVGAWHQAILGLADGWQDKGSSGAVFDVESTKPQLGFGITPEKETNVIIEVKNKHNTIKASDEHLTHSKLHQQAASRPNTVAYLIQIVPKGKARYNRQWVPSQAFASPKVFVMDGATAYDLIFKEEEALKQLYEVLPALLQDVRESLGLSDGLNECVQITQNDWENFQRLFTNTFGK